MRSRGIIFGAPMVRAILAGEKTQTRRLKPLAVEPGDELWVREAWRVDALLDGYPPRDVPPAMAVRYEAGGGRVLMEPGRYRHARFMPRWASRLTLRVIGVRMERLGDITEADALAEGVVSWAREAPGRAVNAFVMLPWSGTADGMLPRETFVWLWDSVNGDGAWERDCGRDVQVITFEGCR